MRRGIALALTAVLLTAAAVAIAAPVRFRTVERDEGSANSIKHRTAVAITSLRHWRSIWRRLHSGQSPQPPRPRVDFSRHMLILATMGEQRSGGHSIRIRTIESRRATWLVRIDERSPGAGCMTTAVMTSPYHVVRVRRTSKRIVARHTPFEYDCELYQP